MSRVDEGLRSQVRNIEATYGRPIDAWIQLIEASGRTKHTEVVAMLKADHGMTHGAAHRVSLVAREAIAARDAGPGTGAPADPVDQLYEGRRSALRPVHDALMAALSSFGEDIELAPKKGYVSLRRRKQFGMIQPASARVDVGLILTGAGTTHRLESAAGFNALFTHRVRVSAPAEVDAELVGWLRQAYDRAG